MNESTNHVVLAGRIAKDPGEIKITSGGERKCMVRIAFAQHGPPPFDVGFARATFWDDLAEEATKLRKGAPVAIAGRVKYANFDRAGVVVDGLEIEVESLGKPGSVEDLDFRLGRTAAALKRSGAGE